MGVPSSKLNLQVKTAEESIPARVVRVVRQAILDGSLPPGRRLTERELCDLTGVSRTSIREAITHLQNLGLVEAGEGRGIRVVMLEADAVPHIYQVREALEAAAAELFVRNATDEQVERLIRAVPPEDCTPEQGLRLVLEFDRLLLEGAGNPLLRETLEPIRDRIHAVRRLSTSVPGRQKESSRELMAIATAIRQRSASKAATATRRHIRAAAAAAQAALRDLSRSNDDRRLLVR